MKELLNMTIAGVRFTLNGESFINLHKSDPAYEFFLNQNTCRTSEEKIYVTLETEKGIPEIKDYELVFESGQSWSLYQNEDSYTITLSPPECLQPLWLARSNKDFTQVTVYVSDQLITKEDHTRCVVNPLEYPLDQILLMHFLAGRQGLIVHAMGIGRKGMGFIFPGISGAGKSTLAKRLLSYSDIELLSDDRIVIRRFGDELRVFGTPWPGEAGNALNKGYSLKGIFFIKKKSLNKKVKICGGKAIENLFSVASIPWYDRELVNEMLGFCEHLISNVPAYELHCRPDIGIEDVFV